MHNAEWEIAAAAAAVDHVEARIAALESEGARTAGYETVIRDGKPMRIFRMPGGFTEGGQFSRPGWSGTKSLLARFIRGLFARDHVKDHGDSWLLPRANSLAELGVPDGHPVRVRYFNDEFGVIDVKGRYSTTPTKVAWDRFSDTLPTEDQIAAVVDLPSAPDMGDDPNGTAAQRRIAEITGIYDSEHGFPDPLTEAGTPALSGVDIAAENLIGEDLSGRYIMGSNLRGASLSKSKLDRANLTDSDLTNANLVAARAVGTDFTGVDFTAAEAGYIKARDADFTGATFSVSTDFGHADLRGSRFDGDLTGLFDQANLSGADLSGVTTMPERLTGAVYDEDTVFPDGFDPEAAGMIRDIRAVPDSVFFSKDDSVARRDRFNGIEIGDRTVNVGDRWDAQGGSDAYREMFSGEVVEIVGPSSEGKGVPTLRIRRDNGEMSAVPVPNGTPVGKIETDTPGGAGHDPSLGADAPTATSATANVYREADPQTLLRQIGNGNVLAVSGGRWTPIVDQEGRTVGVRLPVRYGYAVEARLAADDTYEVRRTFTRGATTTVKGEEAGVYAGQVGDTVYRASNFRDPFGPADDATYQILRTDGQPSLFDMVDNPGGATPTPAEELAAKINEADPASKAEAVAIDLSKAEGAPKGRPADAPDWAVTPPVTPPVTVEYDAVAERDRMDQALRAPWVYPEMLRTRSAPKVDGGPVGPGERVKKEGLDALAVGQAFKAQEPGRPVDYYQKVGDGLYLKSTYGFEDFPRYVSDVGGWPGWHGETIEPNIDASSLTHSIAQNADGKFDVVGPDGAVLATFDTAAEAVGDWGRESRNHQLGIKTVTYRGKRYEVHPGGMVATADPIGKKRVGESTSEKIRALAGVTVGRVADEPPTPPTPEDAATFKAFVAHFPVAPSETDVANNMAVLEPFARTALRQLGRDKPRRGFMRDMVDTYAPIAGAPSTTPMSQKQVRAALSALDGEIRKFAANVDAGDATGPEFVQDRTPGGIAVTEQVDDRGRRLSSARGVTDIVALTKMFTLRESDPATTVFFAQSHHDYRGGPLPWLVSVGKADGTRATVGKLSGGKLRFADGTEVDVPGDDLRAAIDAIDAHGGFIQAPAPDAADPADVESPAALANRLDFPGDLAASKAAMANLTTRELVDAYQKLDVPDPTVRIDDAATAVAIEAAARGIEMSFDADGNIYVWRAGEIDNADAVPLTAAEIDAIPRPGDTPDAGADTTIAADTVTPVTFRVQLPGGVVSRKQREGFLTGDGQNIVDADGQTLAHVENVVIDTRGEPVPAPNTPTPDATPEAPTVEPAAERPMSTREFGVMAADTLGEKRAFTFPDDRAADVERVAPHMQYGSGYIRGVMDDLAEASRAYSNGDTAEGDRLLDGVVSRVDRMTARRAPDVAPEAPAPPAAPAVDTPETPGINRTIATPEGVVIAQQRHVDISGEPVPADAFASDVSDTPDVPDATPPVGSPFKTDAPKATTRNVTKALEHAGLSPARYDGRMPERQPGDVWVAPQERNAFNMQDYVAAFPHPDTAEQAASALEAAGFDVKRKLDLIDASGSPHPTLYVYEKGVLGDKLEAAAPEPILSDADVAAGATIDGYSGGARRVSRTGRRYDVSETGEVTLNGKRVAGATASKVRTQASYEAAREAKAEAKASAQAVDLTEPIDPAAPVPEAGITVAAETIAEAANKPPTPDQVDIPAGEAAATVETATAGDLPEPEEPPKVEPLPSGKFPPTAEQLDALVKFASGKHLVMEAGAGAGKALRDDQPVLTEHGWVPIADVRVGDRVAGTDGFGWVTGVFPQGIRDTVEVVLSDGQVIVCDWDHLWDTQTEQERKRGVSTTKTTREIARTIRSRGGTRKQHYLPTVQPVKFPEADLPVDPWLLGYLLGNGSVSSGRYVVVSSQDDWALGSVAAALPAPLTLTHDMGYDWRVKGTVPAPSVPGGKASPLHASLRELGLWGIRDEAKFIPAAYLFASVDQRRALLAGLLDADGYANGRTCEIFTVSDRLAEGIRDLCNSLGWTASGATKTPTFTYRGERRVGQTGTRFYITPSRGENPFTMPRKRDAFTPRTKYPARRCIVDVRPAGQAPCTCISVDTADHLYLTAGYTPTHNTASLVLLANQAKAAGRRGMFTAFNKLIVEDAAERMPDTAPALTMHSVAYRALLGSGKKWIAGRLKSKGLRRIEEARILGLDRVEMPAVGGDAGDTVKIGPTRLAAWVMMGLDRFAQSADTEPSIDHLVSLPGVQGRVSEADYAKLQSMAVAAMRRGWDDLTSENGKLRFKHGHYLKMFDLSKPDLGLDFIMMDEGQDSAPVMLSILRRQAERGTQIVVVGDSAQAVNAFTGAVDAIDIAKQTFPDVQVSTLSQSFRFGPEIAEPANNVLAWFTPFRIAGAGNPSSVGDVPDPDAVLTRTNGTAMATAISAMEEGKTVGMSDNLRRALTEFSVGAKQLQVDGQTDQPDLAPFESWNEVLRWVEEDPAGAELKTLVGLVDRYGPDELLGYLAKVGGPGDGDLTVLTAHSSKGLQFDTVRLADDFPQLRDDNGVLQLADDDFMLMYVALTRAKKRLDPGANTWITEPPPGETVRPAPRAQIAEGFSIPDEVQSWLDVWLDTPEEAKSNGRGDGWVSGHAGLVGQTNVAPGRQTWMRKVTGKGGGAGRVSPKNSEFVDNAIDSEKVGDGWRIIPHFPGDGLYEIQTEHTTRSGERKTERQLIVVKDGVAAHPDYTSMDRAAAEGRDWWDPQNIDLLDTPVEVVDVPLDGAPSTPGTTPDPVTAPERVGPYADLLNRYTSKLVDSDVENDPALKTQASEVLAAMAEADAFDSDFLESVWTKAANKLRRDQRDWDGQADPDGPRPELVDLSTKQARAVLNSARRWMETQSNPDGPPEPAAKEALPGAPVDGVADVEPPADITRPWRVDQIRAAVSRGHMDLTAAQINTADPVVATTYGERQRDGSIRVTATPGLLVDGDFYPAAEPTVVERIPKFGGGKELAKWLGRQKLTDGVSVHDMGDAKPLADRTVSELLGTTYSVEDVAKLLRRGGLTEQQRAELRNILEQLGGVVAALTTPEAAMPVDVEYPGGAVLLARVRPNISNDAEPHLAALSECDNETTLLINDEPVAAWVPGVVPTRDEVEAVVAALGWRFDSEDAWTLAAAPPAERCRVAGVSPTWLVAADNYLSRLGVRRGEAVPVRWGDDTSGLIDADDDGTIKQVPVSWERFSDEVPTADMQFVDTPHIVKNRTATESGRGRRCAERIRDAGIGYASVADKYLGKWGIFKGDTVPVRWLDDDTALVLAIDGQPIKAAWSRFSDDDPNEMNVADLDLVDGSAYQDMPPGAVFAVEAFGRPVSTPDGRTAFVKNADGSFSQADSPVVAWQWDPRVGAHLQLLVAVEAEES